MSNKLPAAAPEYRENSVSERRILIPVLRTLASGRAPLDVVGEVSCIVHLLAGTATGISRA
jgi:hypothetical protein